MENNYINKIICGDAISEMKNIEDNCISLIVTSPPYWNLVDYNVEGQYGQGTYEEYLYQMLNVYKESERILEPNGKIALVVPIVPLPKAVDDSIHTRKILNLSSDIEQKVLNSNSSLHRFSLYIWQKQTSKKMFGSYPYPPNIYEDNTIEFINVFVKDGQPKKLSKKYYQTRRMVEFIYASLAHNANKYPKEKWQRTPSPISRRNPT